MKNFKYLFLLPNLLLFLSTTAQKNDDKLIRMVAKTCQTDSIINALQQVDEDSLVTFNFKTPDAMEFGIGEYDFKTFLLLFDTGSNLLFKGLPYGSLEDISMSNKKATFTIHILGDGDRKSINKFESATYTFLNKKGRWVLSDVKYQ